MAHTHDLIEAEIALKARNERQRKMRNDEMVTFKKILLCLFFFLFQFSHVIKFPCSS